LPPILKLEKLSCGWERNGYFLFTLRGHTWFFNFIYFNRQYMYLHVHGDVPKNIKIILKGKTNMSSSNKVTKGVQYKKKTHAGRRRDSPPFCLWSLVRLSPAPVLVSFYDDILPPPFLLGYFKVTQHTQRKPNILPVHVPNPRFSETHPRPFSETIVF
jgi:hypothetical protein